MTYAEFKKLIEEKTKNLDTDEYEFFGLRFENKEYKIGDICLPSKHNPNREDERDFPEYGSEEYEELEELCGTSAWLICSYNSDVNMELLSQSFIPGDYALGLEFKKELYGKCYIIAGYNTKTHDDADCNEIVIKDAVVVDIIF